MCLDCITGSCSMAGPGDGCSVVGRGMAQLERRRDVLPQAHNLRGGGMIPEDEHRCVTAPRTARCQPCPEGPKATVSCPRKGMESHCPRSSQLPRTQLSPGPCPSVLPASRHGQGGPGGTRGCPGPREPGEAEGSDAILQIRHPQLGHIQPR